MGKPGKSNANLPGGKAGKNGKNGEKAKKERKDPEDDDLYQQHRYLHQYLYCFIQKTEHINQNSMMSLLRNHRSFFRKKFFHIFEK